jgi:release factor glutamine methyltransferase
LTTIGDALEDAKRRLTPISTSASLDAQLLLAEVLAVNRAHILARREKVLTPDQTQNYASLVARREQGEPIAYILGRKAFYDRDFVVTPAVLIPRPETEHLLEIALTYANDHPHATFVDVGVGSGAIAVTLAANVPSATVYATEISPDALAVATENAQIHQANVRFFAGDLLAPLIERNVQINCVMANLPYIKSVELSSLDVSKFEPKLALDGGVDGLDDIRRLLAQCPTVCRPSTLILLEIGADQGEATRKLAVETLASQSVEIIKDLAGHDRVARIQLE